MTISALPAAPDPATDSPSEFSAKAAAHVLALSTFRTEANALAAAMNAIAAGGAMAIPYTFSTTTTDADPGAGTLRLDNATQNLATTIRADLAGSDGSTWTAVLDTFDDSTSTVKGHIMLQKLADATKWIVFSVSALASPSGYKNITVAVVASSTASPFADGDSIVLKFTRNGDKGDTGSAVSIGNHCVSVHTGNGHGSTSTKIRRFTTALTSVGTAITYADSSTLGGTFTINEDGIYAVKYRDAKGAGASYFGISLNSAELTTSIDSITIASMVAFASTPSAGLPGEINAVVKLSAGDVVRAHTNAQTDASTAATSQFTIRKVST
jgi:hypothetical protein